MSGAHRSAVVSCLRFDGRLGPVTLTGNGHALTGFYYGGQKYHPQVTPHWCLRDDDTVLNEAREQYLAYEQGRLRRFDLALDLSGHGTPFQQRVWQALLGVGFGHTLSYGELADRVATRAAVRAVGAAVGRNPVSVIVPCHRILGANGSLTGYAGGLERKRALLTLEGALLV